MTYHLGKKPTVDDPRDFKLTKYVDLKAVLPLVPKSFGHELGVKYPMCGNGPDDSVHPGFGGAGDCVFAGGDHETQVWRHASGMKAAMFNGSTAIHDYSAVTGYVIGNEATDQGTNVREALNYRRKVGLLDTVGGRHKITAYLALTPGNVDHLYAAMWLFECVGIGINFPASAMAQFNAKKPWSVVKNSPSEGGHYIPLVAKRTQLEVVTWGRVQKMTLGFYKANCDEAYAILSPESIAKATGKTAEGFDLKGLQAALASLA